jgi:hypothetical protein
MSPAKRHPEVPWLTLAPTVQTLLDQGEATRGLTVTTPLPYEGTLNELVDVMNTDLAAWAPAWPSL